MKPDSQAHQIGGDHYLKLNVQPWDVMRAWFGRAKFMSYLLMTALKYIARDKSNKREDVQKAIHYLQQWIVEFDAFQEEDYQ